MSDQELCECGCGAKVTPGKRFILGHRARTQERTAESSRKLSESMRRRWQNPENREKWSVKKGEDNPFYGKKHSDDARKKMSEAAKKRKRKPTSEETKLKIGKANKGRNVGQLSGHWKGGTSLESSIVLCERGVYWKELVIKRFNSQCDLCQKYVNGFDLVAHHILPLKYIIKRYQLKSMADVALCHILWDTLNGVVLCRSCHMKVHSPKRNYTKRSTN